MNPIANRSAALVITAIAVVGVTQAALAGGGQPGQDTAPAYAAASTAGTLAFCGDDRLAALVMPGAPRLPAGFRVAPFTSAVETAMALLEAIRQGRAAQLAGLPLTEAQRHRVCVQARIEAASLIGQGFAPSPADIRHLGGWHYLLSVGPDEAGCLQYRRWSPTRPVMHDIVYWVDGAPAPRAPEGGCGGRPRGLD